MSEIALAMELVGIFFQSAVILGVGAYALRKVRTVQEVSSERRALEQARRVAALRRAQTA